MHTRAIVVGLLALPVILACAGLPGGGTEAPPAPPTSDAVTDLDAAVGELGAALTAAEALDPAAIAGPRLPAARERLRAVVDSLQFAVERALGATGGAAPAAAPPAPNP